MFEDSNSGPPLNLTGDGTNNGLPKNPWMFDGGSNCDLDGIRDGTNGLKAKDVDTETIVSFVAPQGATSVTFSYTMKRQSDVNTVYNFEVIVNDDQTPSRQYGVYPDTDEVKCALDCLNVSGGDVLKFRCVSNSGKEQCRIDNVRFHGY